MAVEVMAGVGSGVDCNAPTCLGRLKTAKSTNTIRAPRINNWRVLFGKDFMQIYSFATRGIIPKSV